MELKIRTTLTPESVHGLFGAPGAIDYRSHPGGGKDEDPMMIFKGMKLKETKPLSDISVLKGSIYSYKNRKIITRWLRDVCAALHLKSTTLCLAVQLCDTFLVDHLSSLQVDRCQLVAITSLWIAAKFEEMDEDLPSLKMVVDVCDNAYTATEILNMEESILSFFKWRLPHTTVINYVYLHIHLLNSEALVHRKPLAPMNNTVRVSLLTIGQGGSHEWSSVSLPITSSVQECMPKLCAAARIPNVSNIDVYQLFGQKFILSKRTTVQEAIGSLSGDEKGELRLFLSPTSSQLGSIFAENSSYSILRSANSKTLDLCDLLTHEVVVHVEFLRLPSHITALGIVALAFCLHAGDDLQECKAIVQLIHTTLGISASQALATADLLATKYKESLPSLPPSPALVAPKENIREALCYCFDRSLT